MNKNEKNVSAIRVRKFSEVKQAAKAMAPAVRLYGNCIYKGEVTIVAGNTGAGKSLLGVNIAIAIAKGKNDSKPFQNEDGPNATLYVDLELSDRQFDKRFKGENYPENLYRLDVNPECTDCGISIDIIRKYVEDDVIKVLIIDNLSAFYLTPGVDADVAVKIMSGLKEMQKKLDLTIIVIAHTPKLFPNTILTVDNIAGSKQIANFADSAVFIAKSSISPNTRYLKHVKGRNDELPEEVYQVELAEKEEGIVFEYSKMTAESEHFYEQVQAVPQRIDEAKQLREEGKTLEEIGKILNVNKGTVSRWLSKS